MAALVVGLALMGLVTMTSLTSVMDVKSARQAVDQVRAKAAAEAGVQQAFALCDEAMGKNPFAPLDGVSGLFGGGNEITPYLGVGLEIGGSRVAAYSVSMTLDALTADQATVTIESTGYLPDAPTALAAAPLDAWASLSVTVVYSVEPSSVFDFAYFVNNWGWLYGSTIYCNGNAGSNGQFDSGGYGPTITGQPIYESISRNGASVQLNGYKDDNGDGLKDGNDGGIFAGWDVVSVQNVAGNGGKAENQHDFQDSIEMPNLSDLSMYEAKAVEESGRIRVGGTTVVDAIYGDDAGELQNLYLVGTAADPIILDGPVVVEGDVIIHGVVTGQGAIYSGGNVYVPNDLTYLDPPTSTRPADNTQASTEAWLSANWNKDFLGLFASESVIVGDYTNSSWEHYVSGWMSHALNQSAEDAGEDGIPNTIAGKDGILGTADDDVLEGDGLWTTEVYTDADAALGLIPSGYSVGDPIPGTGEDIDGDGQYDATITMADIAIADPLDAAHWGGNIPGALTYDSIASIYATQLNATIYTNHTFAWVTFGSTAAQINGAMITRNEDIIYGTPTIEMNYDCRLLGGGSGLAGSLLPKTASEPVVVRWVRLENDPHFHEVAP